MKKMKNIFKHTLNSYINYTFFLLFIYLNINTYKEKKNNNIQNKNASLLV